MAFTSRIVNVTNALNTAPIVDVQGKGILKIIGGNSFSPNNGGEIMGTITIDGVEMSISNFSRYFSNNSNGPNNPAVGVMGNGMESYNLNLPFSKSLKITPGYGGTALAIYLLEV